MATSVRQGQTKWGGGRDDEGYRTYTVTHLVVSDTGLDGPANVMQTPGLPVPGSYWLFDDDVDVWAWCRPGMRITARYDGEKCKYFEVEQTFSNKPPSRDQGSSGRCADESIEDPLLQPPRISVSFASEREEALNDKDGNPIRNSAFELIRGPQNEWDSSWLVVRIVKNVSQIEADLLSSMMNTLNESALWGFPKRCVKLSNAGADKQWYGTCNSYATRTLEFEVKTHKADAVYMAFLAQEDPDVDDDPVTNPRFLYSAWDRAVPDEGTKALNGFFDDTQTNCWLLAQINGAAPDRTNPAHFVQYTDRNGNPARVFLDGNGEPAEDEASVGTIRIKKYLESDFTLLGIPTELE